jgi:Flp pilus assembly protein TadB
MISVDQNITLFFMVYVCMFLVNLLLTATDTGFLFVIGNCFLFKQMYTKQRKLTLTFFDTLIP